MTYNMTIYRDHEPLSLIIRATITKNYDAPGSFLGEGDWIIDLDAVTDDQGRPVELTEEEEQEVVDRIVR
jgi:hypothetical protein